MWVWSERGGVGGGRAQNSNGLTLHGLLKWIIAIMSYVAVKAVVILFDISKDRGLCCSFFCPLLVYLWRCHTLQLVVTEYSTQRKLGKTWVPSWTRLHRSHLSPPAIEVQRRGRKGSDRRGRERRRAHPCPCLDSAVGNTAPCLGLYLFMISIVNIHGMYQFKGGQLLLSAKLFVMLWCNGNCYVANSFYMKDV